MGGGSGKRVAGFGRVGLSSREVSKYDEVG